MLRSLARLGKAAGGRARTPLPASPAPNPASPVAHTCLGRWSPQLGTGGGRAVFSAAPGPGERGGLRGWPGFPSSSGPPTCTSPTRPPLAGVRAPGACLDPGVLRRGARLRHLPPTHQTGSEPEAGGAPPPGRGEARPRDRGRQSEAGAGRGPRRRNAAKEAGPGARVRRDGAGPRSLGPFPSGSCSGFGTCPVGPPLKSVRCRRAVRIPLTQPCHTGHLESTLQPANWV